MKEVYRILFKIMSGLGVVVIAFWFGDYLLNQKTHNWTDFNLSHPIIMGVGFICAICAVLFLLNKKDLKA